jgi:hypothetical protein
MATTTIHVREIRPSEDEAREMDALGVQAFTDVPVHRIMFPRGEETRAEELRWRSERFYTNIASPGKRFVVAVEETMSEGGSSRSEIIGWAMWTPDFQPGPDKSEEEREQEWQDRMEGLPDIMDKQAYRSIVEGFGELQKQWLDGDDPRSYWGEVASVVPVRPNGKFD